MSGESQQEISTIDEVAYGTVKEAIAAVVR